MGLRVESRALGCKENVEECGGVPVGRLDPSDQDLGNSQVQDRQRLWRVFQGEVGAVGAEVGPGSHRPAATAVQPFST